MRKTQPKRKKRKRLIDEIVQLPTRSSTRIAKQPRKEYPWIRNLFSSLFFLPVQIFVKFSWGKKNKLYLRYKEDGDVIDQILKLEDEALEKQKKNWVSSSQSWKNESLTTRNRRLIWVFYLPKFFHQI